MTGKRPSHRFVVVVVALGDDEGDGVRATLRALGASAWPGGGGEIVVVSPSGGGWPTTVAGAVVRHVAVAPGTAWSDAAGRGAAVAATEGVAILRAGARPRPDWLEAPARMLYADRSIAAVAPALSWSGGPPQVPAGRLRFDAVPLEPVPPGAGGDGGDAAGGRPAEVLFAAPPAVVVAREALESAGGLRPGTGAVGAAVELGWRLWLLGWRVLTCPASVVDLDVGGSDPEDASRRAAGDRADALRTVFTHYDDGRQATALRAAVAVAEASGPGGRAAVAALDGRRPDLEGERAALQARRRRGDADVLRLFADPVPEDVPGLGPDDRRRLGERWGDRRRIAVVTPDVVGTRMAGPAIRAWHMAVALAAEHDVRLLATGGVAADRPAGLPVEPADAAVLRDAEQWCDVLVVQGFVLQDFPFLRETQKVLVADVYDPLHLEQLELTRAESDVDRCGATLVSTHVLNDQLAHADFLLCASPKQRDFWLGQMAGLGRVNPRTYDDSPVLDRLLAVVPFGLPPEPPAPAAPRVRGVVEGIGADDDVIVWGGGVYNWFDPLTLLHAVDRLRRRRPQVRLYFMGMRHPGSAGDTEMAAATRGLAADLGLDGTHVFFNEDWVPYEQRGSVLLEADIGVSTHFDHVETAFSFRTRILDYLWAGLPIVSTRGDSFSDLVEARGLGVTVPPEDVEALEDALLRILDDRALRERCRAAVAAARPEFTWPVVLEPLLTFCRRPRRAPDLVDPAIPIARPRPADRSDSPVHSMRTLAGRGRRLLGRARRALAR